MPTFIFCVVEKQIVIRQKKSKIDVIFYFISVNQIRCNLSTCLVS